MEVNSNPSLNIFLERELPNGEVECTLSELDKYLKSLVISDAIKLARVRDALTIDGLR
jgi:hypothetical protein